MSNASRDENFVPTILGVWREDGKTTIPIKADPPTHALYIQDSATGTDQGGTVAGRDENGVTSLMAVSSVDGVTPVPIYATQDGKLFIDSSL
jgi:hypothetical protein